VGIAVLAAGLALLAMPVRADAHAELESSEPASGEQLATAPTEVVLHFTEAVDLTGDTLTVLDADGERLDIGEPEHPRGEGASVAASLPGLDDGAYVVAWRVVSSDSHPIGGAFTFRVGEAGADAADDQALIDEVLGGSRDGDSTLGAVFGAVRFAGLAGITVLVGSVAFVAWLWPSGAGDRRARRLVTAAWAATVVATGLSIPLQGAYVAAGTLGDALGLDVVADEMGARTGRAWVVRLLLLAAAAVLLPRLARAASSTGARAASVVGGVALLATISLTGHAVSGDLVPLAFVTDVVHLSAVSVWLGGLAVLVVALLWEGADAPDDEVEAVVGRFSPVAFAAVVAIVASGTVQGWRQVGSYDALLETGYGRLLVLKVALVGAMLVAAAVSRSWCASGRRRAPPRWRCPRGRARRPSRRAAGGRGCRCCTSRWASRRGWRSSSWPSPRCWSTRSRARPPQATAGAAGPSPPGSPRTTSSSASTSTRPRADPCRCTSTSTSPAAHPSSGSRR
jgi:copper transport protein